MKKSLLLLLLLIFYLYLGSEDIQRPYLQAREDFTPRRIVESSREWTPLIDFVIDPVPIATSYYDYMPGGYNAPPIVRQINGGYYLVFMYQENAAAQRRIYYVYIDADGNLTTPLAVSPNNIREGYAGVDIDPMTQDPLVSWHSNVDGENELEDIFTYDLYNILDQPGVWAQPYVIIDNPVEEFLPYDEFIWPVVRIGPSPIAGSRRVHIYANYDPNAGNAMYNIIYGNSDFYFDESQYSLIFSEWTWRTFPILDAWQDDQTKRAIKDMAVSKDEGQVAFIGHAEDSLLVLYSTDYGDNFEYISRNAHFPVFNPWNIDPVTEEPTEPFFLNNDNSEAEVFIEPNGDGGHYNAIFADNNSKILFMSAMGLNTVETAADQQYYPAHFHPKIFIFDTLTQEFDFVDLQITGVDPTDEQPMIPYDLDEDGVVDSWNEEGIVEFVNCWPTYYFNGDLQDGSFHESLFKVAKNEEQGWIVAIFQDGRKLYNAFYEEPGYEDWSEVAEIALAASTDHGVTWSDPAYMNAKADDLNYYPQLEGMLPCYVYIAEDIEYISENIGRIRMFWMDDNSYGSFAASGYGQNNGGQLNFVVMDIDFSGGDEADENVITVNFKLSQNYPNPFNPSTTIKYDLKEADNIELSVYNIRGQKIRTLDNGFRQAGEHHVVWNGADSNNRQVPSGIYFYRLRSKEGSDTRKMVLMQ